MQEASTNIISTSKTGNTTTIILATGSYLGETSIKELPHGIIDKTETGIGATTLELNSTRNSIIVEPHKITASSKAYKHKALYIGTPTKYHPKKVTDKEIKEYLLDTSKQGKKIVVVTDSLPRLIKVMNSIDQKEHDKYFLMLDEVDSFQHDSTFRGSMELSLDIYKKFDQDKRAMVTATMIPFSDPELEHEPRTIFKYDVPTLRGIDFISAENLEGKTIDKIKELIASNPNDKIMIAYNSVTGSYDLAEHLVKDKIINKADIKILCSINSEKIAKDYFAELSDDVLPAKLCFCTSAYFSGYDLKEKYHLVSLSTTDSPIYTLSDHKIKQIAGRGRKGLLSETIVYSTKGKTLKQSYTKDDLINSATKVISSLECLERHFSTTPLLKDNLKKTWESVANTVTIDTFTLVRYDANGKPQISYLNIDAYLESVRVREEVYKNDQSLYQIHKTTGHTVSYNNHSSKTVVVKQTTSKTEKLALVNEVIKQLKGLKSPEEIEDLLNNDSLSTNQRNILLTYHQFKDYVDSTDLISHLEIAGKQDKRGLKSFKKSADFVTMDNGNPYKRAVLYHFPIGSTFTGEEMVKKWNAVFSETGFGTEKLTPVSAVRLTNEYFTTKRGSHSKSKEHTISGLYKLKVTALKSDTLTTKKLAP